MDCNLPKGKSPPTDSEGKHVASTTAAPLQEHKPSEENHPFELMSWSITQPEIKTDVAAKYPPRRRQKEHSISLCLPFLSTKLSSVSPYYFEKAGVILRAESNPSWRLIKAAAWALTVGEPGRKRRWKHTGQLLMSTRYTGCVAL